MAFDPDSYLNKQQQPFNPDQYLGSEFDFDSVEEIGSAPELNALSVPAFKASLGLLTTGDQKSLQGIFKSQFGDDVSFTQVGDQTLVNLPSGQYALNKPGLSAQDVAKFTSDVLAFTPAGRLTTIPKVAGASALTESGLQATEQALGGEDVQAEDVVASGLLGGFFKGAEDLIGAGYRAFRGSPKNEIVEQATDAGIPIMTSDVSQPQTFAGKMAQQTAEKIPVAGTGGLRETQQKLREQAVSDVAERYGQYSYSAIVDSLKAQKNKVKSAAGSVLQSTGNKLDDVGEIPLSNTMESIESVKDELSKPGVIKSQGAFDDLNTLVEAISEAPQTFTSLKENRTAFRDIIAGADKAERSQLTSRAKSLLQKVESSMKKDMDSFAKGNLTPQEFSKWNKANAVYAEEAKKLTKTRLKNVLDKGDVTPESVQTVLFSQKPSELKNLYNSLTSEGRTNARSAIISNVFDILSKRQSGVTPNSFASELKKIEPQINQFFKGKEKKQLEGLKRVLESTRRAQDASITTPTGQTLLGAGTGYLAFTDLLGTAGTLGTIGSAGRIYESAPVRDALLKLASVPKGSTKFEKALLDVQTALSSASQSARSQSGE